MPSPRAIATALVAFGLAGCGVHVERAVYETGRWAECRRFEAANPGEVCPQPDYETYERERTAQR